MTEILNTSNYLFWSLVFRKLVLNCLLGFDAWNIKYLFNQNIQRFG